MEKILVRHKESGLIYALWKNGAGYYLSNNDGRVPGGQQIYVDSIEEVLREYPLELVGKIK